MTTPETAADAHHSTGLLDPDLGRELVASALLMILSFASAGVLVAAALGMLWLFG